MNLPDLNPPPDTVESAKNVAANLLPTKSREKYESIYEKFILWQKTQKETAFSENLLIIYFTELSKNFKPSTLWSQYSMLKTTIIAKNNIDISTYRELNAFLKRQATGFKSKTTNVLTSNEVEEFLNKAPDEIYLATKVALILGVTGACRREELCNISVKDITDNGAMALVTIPRTQTNVQRSFTVIGEFYNIFKKYKALRPKIVATDRFFLNYRNGRCTQQVIGINKFGGMPKQIARYLKLPDPESYTGHSFRRTSTSLLADTGADVSTLKRHIGWKCNRVGKGYIEDSLDDKIKICKQITESVLIQPSNFPPVHIEVVPTLEELSSEGREGLDSERQTDDGASTSENASTFSAVDIKVEPLEVSSPERTEGFDDEDEDDMSGDGSTSDSTSTFYPVDIKLEPTLEAPSPKRRKGPDEEKGLDKEVGSNDGAATSKKTSTVNIKLNPTIEVPLLTRSKGLDREVGINDGTLTLKSSTETSKAKNISLTFNQCSNITINFIVEK